MLLDAFLRARTRPDPTNTTRVKHFVAAFRAGLPPEVRTKWTRTRVVTELCRLGHEIGHDEHEVQHIVGLTLIDGPTWRVQDGRLVRSI